MSEAAAIEPAVSEPLTWEQICGRYPDQWVVLVEIHRRGDEDPEMRFQTARVAGTGKTSRESLDRARPVRRAYSGFGHFYTGTITRSIAHLLA